MGYTTASRTVAVPEKRQTGSLESETLCVPKIELETAVYVNINKCRVLEAVRFKPMFAIRVSRWNSNEHFDRSVTRS